MIITCPHCQTKYQVTYEAIGSAGRKVQCAHCNEAWDQRPLSTPQKKAVQQDDDRLFAALEEDALDEALRGEERLVSGGREPVPAFAAPQEPAAPAVVPKSAPVDMRKQQAAFWRRQNAMSSQLPMARLRRGARIAGVLVLAGLVSGAYFGRVPVVERYPTLASLYQSVGLGVNIVGLDFSGLDTLKTLSGGQDVLRVSAQIVGLGARPVRVPPVVVSLLDDKGHPVYEWSVTPRVPDLMAGERATFDTQLSSPPSEAVRVRLRFADGVTNQGGRAPSPQASASQPIQDHAEADPPAARDVPAEHD